MEMLKQIVADREKITDHISFLNDHVGRLDQVIAGFTALASMAGDPVSVGKKRPGTSPIGKAKKNGKAKASPAPEESSAKAIVLSAATGPEWLSSGEIASAVGDRLPRASIYAAISLLRKEGYLDRQGVLGSFKYRAKRK